jgi:hypothetical protein
MSTGRVQDLGRIDSYVSITMIRNNPFAGRRRVALLWQVIDVRSANAAVQLTALAAWSPKRENNHQGSRAAMRGSRISGSRMRIREPW